MGFEKIIGAIADTAEKGAKLVGTITGKTLGAAEEGAVWLGTKTGEAVGYAERKAKEVKQLSKAKPHLQAIKETEVDINHCTATIESLSDGDDIPTLTSTIAQLNGHIKESTQAAIALRGTGLRLHPDMLSGPVTKLNEALTRIYTHEKVDLLADIANDRGWGWWIRLISFESTEKEYVDLHLQIKALVGNSENMKSALMDLSGGLASAGVPGGIPDGKASNNDVLNGVLKFDQNQSFGGFFDALSIAIK